MAKGDPPTSPVVEVFDDYVQLAVTIAVTFDNTTRALAQAVVSRDDGCQYHTIVLDVPSRPQAKRLAAPVDGAGPNTYTAAQLSKVGLSTIEDVLALQITAEP